MPSGSQKWYHYVIYFNPSDYPGKYVLRTHLVTGKGGVPSPECIVADSLDAVRKHVPKFHVLTRRHPKDDPCIVETWI